MHCAALKKQQLQEAKVDLTKTIATQLDILSNDVNSCTVSPSSNRCDALSDRTINLLMECKTYTNAVIGGPDEPTFSDAEISGLLEQEQ